MTTYPLEAGEAEAFVPASLAHISNPPTLYLRWGSPREKERQRRVMDEEGAISYADDAMRRELLRGMEELFGPEDFAIWEPQAKSWWDARDSYAKEFEKVSADERPPFEFEGEDRLVEYLEQIARDWRPYRLMQADNKAYGRALAHAINSVIVERFENIDVPIAKAGRYISFACAMAIADKLDTMAKGSSTEIVLRPSQELGIECMKRLFLDKEREGNSASPAPSEQIPDTSKTGTGARNGKSTASARSKRTRASSSGTRNTR